MKFRIAPFGDIWKDGIFNVPYTLTDKYIKMASEYQLKALLLILRNGGVATSCQIAKTLGTTVSDIEDLMEFWIEEGVLSADSKTDNISDVQPTPSKTPKPDKKPDLQIASAKKETLPLPRLTPKDVVAMCKDNESLQLLLNEAQAVLGRTISFSEQEHLLNMTTYYGLPVEVVLMLLHHYKNEKEKGKSIGFAYVTKMAKGWSEEGILTVTDADEKLMQIANSDSVWKEIVELTGIRHRSPTGKQRDMVCTWAKSFDMEMISIACDIMKENTEKPTLNYVDKVLQRWIKEDIKTPADVVRQQQEYKTKNQTKKDSKLQSKPSYDLEQIKKDALQNTEIKF